MEGSSRVVVLIVTWNAAELIETSIGSLPLDVRVVVVDNASADATPDVVRGVDREVRLVENPRNVGFAEAVNTGLAMTEDAEYVLLLNPDARLTEGAVERLVAFADDHPRAAAVAPLVTDDGGRPERAAGGWEPSIPTLTMHELGIARLVGGRSLYARPPTNAPARRDWIAGTCMLLRREALDEVGRFDLDYFLYCEDIDWCRRAREHGWEIWVDPTARAVHRRSTSVNRAGRWIDEHRVGSLDRYYAKRHGAPARLVFRLVRAIGKLVRGMAFGVAGFVLRRPDLRARSRQRFRDARSALARLRRR